MKTFLKSGYVAFLLAVVGLMLTGGGVRAQGTPPEVAWTFLPPDGAVYGLGLSEDERTLIAVVGYGFDPGGQIVSLDPLNGSARWTVETPESAYGDPVVVDDVIFAGMGSLVGNGAAIYALDAATGDQIWRTDVENRSLPATPIDALVYADGKLFVNRGDAVLLKLDAATGSIEWEQDLEKPTRGAPAVSGDTVYVSTGFDGARIIAIDAANGQERWHADQPENPVTGPVFDDGVLYVASTSGELIAFDPMTGAELWRTYVGAYDEEVGIDPYPGLPLIANGRIYLSSNGFAGAMTAVLDASTGAEIWSVPTGDFSAGAPALAGNTLLLGSDTGDLLALDAATGAELWRVAVPNKIDLDLDQASPPLISNGMVVVRDDVGSVVALSPASSLRDSMGEEATGAGVANTWSLF